MDACLISNKERFGVKNAMNISQFLKFLSSDHKEFTTCTLENLFPDDCEFVNVQVQSNHIAGRVGKSLNFLKFQESLSFKGCEKFQRVH